MKEEAEAIVMHALCCRLTSTFANFPHNPEELKTFLVLLKDMKLDQKHVEAHVASIFARIMRTIYLYYYHNFHGEHCARLNFDQSVHGWKYHPSKAMMICAPLFFFSPITSIQHLHKIFVDRAASKEKWNAFVTHLSSQLADSNLIATLLVSLNVGFLDSGNGGSFRQIISRLSLMTSFASLMLGLVFVRHNRTESRNSIFAAVEFLGSLWDEKHGLEKLAIIYSLPHAFLVWGMILFFVAISAGWWHSGDLMSWITTGIATFAVSGLVGWCIWTTRDRTKYWWFQADPDQVSFVNNGPEGEARDGRVSRYLLLTKGITHVVHALFHKPNGSRSVGGSNLSVQDFEMSPWPTGESSDVPDEGTRAYQQHGDANCANRSPLIINVQKPTLPFDVSILPPM